MSNVIDTTIIDNNAKDRLREFVNLYDTPLPEAIEQLTAIQRKYAGQYREILVCADNEEGDLDFVGVRPATEEEMAAERVRAERMVAAREAVERREYERLHAKYGRAGK